jgi:hypothetical protein
VRARREPIWVEVKFRVHCTRPEFPKVLDVRSMGYGYLHQMGSSTQEVPVLHRPNYRRKYITSHLRYD